MDCVARALAVFMLSLPLLSACGADGSATDRDDRRYQECLNAGGSYRQEDVNFSCTLPLDGDN